MGPETWALSNTSQVMLGKVVGGELARRLSEKGTWDSGPRSLGPWDQGGGWGGTFPSIARS